MAIGDKTLIPVKNRDNGTVGYTVPELGIRREFSHNETKQIEMQELRKLSWLPGGNQLLSQYLTVENKEALLELLNQEVEPEYFYTEKEVTELLLHGSDDQLLDALDFGPDGVHDLIKDLAVKLKVDSLSKRDIILDKTGFDVTKAIMINEASKEVDDAEEGTTGRRSKPIGEEKKEETAAPARRSKYTITK
ncbi:MAG: hypothetical protein KBT06_04505 [Prevotellaceae bacterium]|nr:hypothetical protein [Candidatus Colivivens equi]